MATVVIKGKRKKQPVEFGADNIDNTAPVKKILNDIQHKHNKAYTFYCQTLRQRPTTKESCFNYHFTTLGHPLNAFSDDWDGDLNSGYFEHFPYKCLLPKMLTKMRNIEKYDPVTEYMKQKSDWNHHSRNLRMSAAFSNMMHRYENLNDDVVLCPKHIVDMAAHLDSDPDPYFDSSYNWYYAGNGNLQLICVDWVDYLLHSEFSTLYLTQFSKNDLSIHPDHSAKFDCGQGKNILETICSSQNIIALRTKYMVLILKIIYLEDKLEIEKVKAMESELPYTSISFDNHHKNILYVTCLDSKVIIVNIDRLKGRTVNLKCRVNTLVDNWHTVIASERAFYTHVATNSITIYDKRTNEATLSWHGLRQITDEVSCNNITVAKHRDSNSSLYIGTDHHFFLMDLRCLNKSKPKAVQRWTHGMQCVPTYMSTCNFEFNKEIICFSSQWCEDTCVVTNYVDTLTRDSEISGVTMPYRPTSILNTLSEAKQKLLCFDLYNPIETRLCTAITGSMIMEQGENYVIMTLNSLGDVTAHTLYPEHLEAFIEDDSVEHLHEWSKDYKEKKNDFEISSLEDFSEVWKSLKEVPESYRIGEGKLIPREPEKFNEQEINDAFENEELDNGLLDIWTKPPDEITVEDSKLSLNLHYSDSE